MSLKKGRFIRAILATFMAVTTPVHASDKSDVERGKALVEKRCSRCHSIGRAGNSRHQDAPAFRTLAKRYPLANLEESLAEGISTGHPDMPEFQIQPREISEVIRYLSTVQDTGTVPNNARKHGLNK